MNAHVSHFLHSCQCIMISSACQRDPHARVKPCVSKTCMGSENQWRGVREKQGTLSRWWLVTHWSPLVPRPLLYLAPPLPPPTATPPPPSPPPEDTHHHHLATKLYYLLYIRPSDLATFPPSSWNTVHPITFPLLGCTAEVCHKIVSSAHAQTPPE